jgi:hypothetical protein
VVLCYQTLTRLRVRQQVVNVCIGTFAFCVMYLLYVLTLDSFYLCGTPPHPPQPGTAPHTCHIRD